MNTKKNKSHELVRGFKLSIRARLSREHAFKECEMALKYARDAAKVALNLGCGSHPIHGLINCDPISDNADQKYSATDLHMFGNGDVDHIETHHMLEHLGFAEAEAAFTEWARVLRDGGTLAITVPDMEWVCRLWKREGKHESQIHCDPLRMIYGSQEHDGMYHKSGYTRKTLAQIARRHGFVPILVHTPYPKRPTPSLFMIASKASEQNG